MAWDNAPIGHTCDIINGIITDLENVRSDNATLREWGNKLYEENEELKNIIEELNRDLDRVIDEGIDYELKCKTLSEEVERLSSNLH